MAEDVGNIGGLLTPREDFVPNLQSAYGAIIQNAPDYQYFTAPLSNLGNPTATYGGQNNLVVAADTPIRVVNNATGEVIYSGTGYEGARAAIDAANSLSMSAGNKANWDIQVTRPGGSVFESVSTDRPNSRTLGLLADIALPIAGSFIPGVGPVLGAALGSGASSVAQGRSLEDTLMRAAIAAGGSYLGGQVLGKAGAGASSGSSAINADLIPNALSGLNFGSITSTAIPAGVGGAATNLTGDLLVNAILKAAPNTTGSIVGSSIANAATNAVNTSQPSTTKTDAVTRDEYGNVVDDTGAIVATAGGKAPTNLLPAALATGAAATAAAAANATGATTTAAEQAATRTGLTPEQTAALNAGATAGGVFGTGLTLSELATLGSLGASAVGSLFGGGSGGTGTGTPYVSPFGAGPAIGGADFRVNPNIKNYEEYGFGGEATFFRPEYNKLVSSGASMGGAPIGGTATTNTPTYTPLIGGTTTGGTTTTGGATTGGTTAVTKQERPAGFTGVVSGQQVGDTQVVDGTTWAYGGDKAGWQMQYKDPTTGNLALLPGNGATNVSSFANNPTVAVNQPYFEQNTANIPGWATTYHGFQQGLMGAGVTGDRKAAAERELFTALETQPFANATALVDYAKGIYNKYTSPSLI